MTRDLNIWRELSPLANGYVPAVPRRWRLIRRMGQECSIECQLEAQHPTLDGYYKATAVFAHQVNFLCHDWVKLTDLVALA